ncbi:MULTISPECIES: hypothetical protein [unclassified Streptomyces]|uniref:hypothetical protein n=1 Tax=unclassified Streptomyces TaxID=2593676 RepID=UPI00037827D0|nr:MULTISPECIES: hypothetical protein [unclassified Streptomyces]MYY03308.1 hypothetical protein [Streptomyces sp. SID4913]
MDQFLPLLVCVGVLATVMGFLGWVAVSVRRRGGAGAAMQAAMASYDEAFRATAHESYYEIRAQADRKAPMASPDDPWRPVYDRRDRTHATRARGSRRHRNAFVRWWRHSG